MRPISSALALALALTACQQQPVTVPRPNLPPMVSPSSHAPAPAPAHGQRPPLPELDPEEIKKRIPAPPQPEVELEPDPESPPPEKPSEAEPEPQEDPAKIEMEAWLKQANELDGGCLLSGQPPDIALPSPHTLAMLLREQPGNFRGVAREALVCLFDLPNLSGAEVYGKNAFRGVALATELRMSKERNKQGIVAFVVTTDHPRGEGTYVGVMDRVGETWELRAGTYLPWPHKDRGRKIAALRGVRLWQPGGRALNIRQRDARRTVEQYIVLTRNDQLLVVFESTVKDKEERRNGRLHIRGRSWPREVVHRSIMKVDDGPDQFRLERWRSAGAGAYSTETTIDGNLDLEGARQALDADFPVDAEWLVGRLPRAVRKRSAAHRLNAECRIARGNYKKANRFFKKAVRAADSVPEDERDFGLYLVERKRHKRAIKRLGAYLDARPEAEDRAEIEAVLQRIGKRR